RDGAWRIPHARADLGPQGRRTVARQRPQFRGDEGAAPPLSAGGPRARPRSGVERRLTRRNAYDRDRRLPRPRRRRLGLDRFVRRRGRDQLAELQRLPHAADGGDEEPGSDPADGPGADGVATRDRVRGRPGGADEYEPRFASHRDLADPGREPDRQDDHLFRRLDLGPGLFGQRDELGRGRDAGEWRDRFARQRRERAVNEGDAVDLVQSAIWMIVVGAGPAVGAAMVVGVAIALLQALTQVQEMTLTFVPKMIAIFVA